MRAVGGASYGRPGVALPSRGGYNRHSHAVSSRPGGPMNSRALFLSALMASTGADMTHGVGAAPLHAVGSFDVKVAPQAPDNEPARAAGFGRMSLDKQFHGDLEGTGKGEMLAAGDGKTSGGYV